MVAASLEETGLRFETDHVADLVAENLLTADDSELRAGVGGMARARVERHHRLDDAVARYAALLTVVAGRRTSVTARLTPP